MKKKYGKIALALSLVLMILWAALGTTTSVAWFSETTPTERNIFNIGELDLAVFYKTPEGYKELNSESNVFNDEALYEPGYVQVVYLKIKNQGDIPFDYQTAVTVDDFDPGINVFGLPFLLQNHLRYGLVFADSEAELDQLLSTRNSAKDYAEADLPLNNYSNQPLAVEGEKYVALIVRMPEEVDNVANYRTKAPKVKLGIAVYATQRLEAD